MKPILELLIEDIKYEIIEIENTSEEDFMKVYNIFSSIYKRCENLKSDAFKSNEKFGMFTKSIKVYRNSHFITEEWLKHGVDNCTDRKYFKIRENLETLITYLKYSQ